MRTSFPLLATVLASSLAAQAPQSGGATVPASLANTFGNVNNNIPFSWSPTRYQQVFLGSELPRVLLMRGLGLRQDDGFSNYPGYPVDMEMKLGYSTKDPATLTNTYDTNFDVPTTPPITVLPRTMVKLPNMPVQRPTNPQEFFIKIPFAVPFTWIQVPTRNLVIEVANHGNGNGNQIFTYPLDAGSGITTTRLYSSGPTTPTGTLGLNYGHVMCFLDRLPVVADYQLYGAGCKGTGGGTGIPALSNTGRPLVNTSFSINLAQAATGTVAVLALGVSDSQYGPFTLPLDLTAAGAPGCKLLASIELTAGAATGSSGSASLPMAIPNDAALAGVTFFNQWLVVDKGANQLGIAFSNAGKATVGDL